MVFSETIIKNKANGTSEARKGFILPRYYLQMKEQKTIFLM